MALNRGGWRTTFLGQSTPLFCVADAAARQDAACAVLAATVPGALDAVVGELAALGAARPLVLAGPAVRPELSRRAGARRLEADPLSGATVLFDLYARGRLGCARGRLG